MALYRGPNIVRNGLQILLDASDKNSYIGTGTNWKDVVNNNLFSSTSYVYPSFVNNGKASYFSFINNGTTVNTIYCYSTGLITNTSTQTTYTRTGWFYLTSYSDEWSPIFQNEIGNNSDMGLTITSGGNIQFRQYTNTGTNGTTSGDYGVISTGTVAINRWNFAAIAVNLTARTVSFYINGNFDSTASSINVIGNSNSSNMVIGGAYADSYTGTRMFKGRIASVSHYNRVLTATEILQNYNATKSRFGLI
jgi:hypothetical protein